MFVVMLGFVVDLDLIVGGWTRICDSIVVVI